MNSQNLYEHIQNHLQSVYGTFTLSDPFNSRCILLVRLYVAIQDYILQNSISGLSCRDAIIHMVYDDSKIAMRDLNHIPASLVLRIIESRLYAPYLDLSEEFLCRESKIAQQIEENRSDSSKSPDSESDLPELRWHDLPSDLFPGIAEN